MMLPTRPLDQLVASLYLPKVRLDAALETCGTEGDVPKGQSSHTRLEQKRMPENALPSITR